MQIVQDVTPPEFGRLLGKKLVLSLPYYKEGFLFLLELREDDGIERRLSLRRIRRMRGTQPAHALSLCRNNGAPENSRS